ncbi:MAG TPA: IclR family transcriptional regulator [Acidimicrobiales bacterium]|nr:IclR family transcriptional regulator [Acidimicrobiales bacterium]
MMNIVGTKPAPGQASEQTIQVIDRAVGLLKTLAASRNPMTSLELARSCGLNRSTTWRILASLEQHGLVERDTASHRFRIGYMLGQLAPGPEHDSLARRARPVLERLAEESGEMVSLALPQRFGVVYLDHLSPPGSAPVPDWSRAMSPERLERAGPPHASATGKVFLAWLPPAEVDAVLPRRLEAFTPDTITDHARLRDELRAVRRDGFAVAYGEYDEFTSAVSAPVIAPSGRLAAIVNLWGPRQRLGRSRLKALGVAVRAAADEVARRLA